MWLKRLFWTFAVLSESVVDSSFSLFPDENRLRLYYGTTISEYIEEPISKAENLMSKVDPNKKSVCVVHGFDGGPDGPFPMALVPAYLNIGGFNVFSYDWSKAAAAIETAILGGVLDAVTIPVSYAVVITRMYDAGKEYGDACVRMSKAGFNLTTLWNVCFSLGAHLCGETGRTVQNSGLNIGRTTGLDPAGPLFQVLKSLTSKDSIFVDQISTDYGGYGTNTSRAHVNCFFNPKPFCSSTDPSEQVQPGCPKKNNLDFSDNSTCSHNFSWKLLLASIEQPDSVQASRSDTCSGWLGGQADLSNVVSIGINIDQSKRGDFFGITNGEPPYGLGAEGTHP